MVKSEIKLGSILSYFTVFVNALINLFFMPFLTLMLGQSEFGIYSLISSIISYMTILDFGFGNAVIVYTSKFIHLKDKNISARLNGMFLLIYSIIGILAFVISLIFYNILPIIFKESMSVSEIEISKILVLILSFNLVITFPFSIFSNIIVAYEKFIFNKSVNLIRVILQPFLMLPLLIAGYKSIALVCVITFVNILCLLINTYFCLKKLKIKFQFKNFDFSLLKEIFSYSFFIFLSLVVVQLNWNIDNIFIAAFWGASAVAVYAIALQINNVFMTFSNTLGNILLPKISIMEEKNATSTEFTQVFIFSARVQFYLVFLLISLFIIFGNNFLNVFFGRDYSDAYLLTSILMLSISLQLIQTLGINILQAKNLYRHRIIIYIALSIINCILSYFCIQKYSYFGAALSTGATTFICEIIMIFYYKKRVGLNMALLWKEVWEISYPLIFLFLIFIIFNFFVPADTFIKIIIYALSYVFLYFILMYFVSMNKKERALIKDPLNFIN